jgi:hypothetical protein
LSLDLARLALRRALAPGLCAVAVLLAVAFLASAWRPAALQIEALGNPAASGFLARRGLWTSLLATLSPILIARAALMLPHWRRGEVDWLLAARRSRASLVLSTFLGLAAGAAVFVGFAGATAELGAGNGGAGRALSARYATPAQMLGSEPIVRRLPLDPLPSGSVLRVRLQFLGGAPAVDVRLTARALDSQSPPVALETRVSALRVLELELPPAAEAIELRLERAGEDALVALQEDGIEIAVPTASARAVSLRVALRAWIALCAALAVALGLGAWLSGAAAVVTSLALAWISMLAAAPLAGRWPAAALGEALELAGEGLAAPWPSARSLALAAVVVAVSLALAASGLEHWRRAA